MTLSARPPEPSDLFAPPQTRDFAPQLVTGDRLAFALRANATRDRNGKGRVDVVMDGLHGLHQAERAARRMEVAQTEGRAWMDRQGAKSGFALLSLQVEDYSVAALPGYRGPRKDQPEFGILDMTGLLTVTDPASFVTALGKGLGRAKSHGCGLMLIRRA